MNIKLPDMLLSKKVKRGFGILVGICLVGMISFVLLAHLASRAAAKIFNYEMEKQTMLRGTITVESIMGHINGDVSFENLVWKEPDGDLVLQVPEGSFHARPWDVVTRHVKSTTVQQLTLKNAVIAIRFNENMQVDFLDQKHKPADFSLPKETPVKKAETHPETNGLDIDDVTDFYDDDRANLNLDGRKLRSEIILEDCRLEVRYRKRHYILNNVNMKLSLNTANMSHIDLSTGRFGGTMRGGGLSVYGDINFKKAAPELDLDVSFRDVDPSSLGFGMNIHDYMTVAARMEGPVTGPTGTGTVKMKELHIPALNFTDVIGDVNYANGLFRFTDVNAKVFGGNLRARGDYHIDTRVYHIYGEGTSLQSMRALNDMRFSCLVDLNLMLMCNGNPRNILAYGDFKSGKGHYSFLPFNSLEGRFTNRFRELHIYDAVIDTPFGKVSTDAFSIVNSKLHLGKIILKDQDSGEEITIREEGKVKPEDQHYKPEDNRDKSKKSKGKPKAKKAAR